MHMHLLRISHVYIKKLWLISPTLGISFRCVLIPYVREYARRTRDIIEAKKINVSVVYNTKLYIQCVILYLYNNMMCTYKRSTIDGGYNNIILQVAKSSICMLFAGKFTISKYFKLYMITVINILYSLLVEQTNKQ